MGGLPSPTAMIARNWEGSGAGRARSALEFNASRTAPAAPSALAAQSRRCWTFSGSTICMSGSRSARTCRLTSISRRARWEPRQKCSPWPKVRNSFSLRHGSNFSGDAKTSGSRFAEVIAKLICEPAGIVVPAHWISFGAKRGSSAVGGSHRSASWTTAGIDAVVGPHGVEDFGMGENAVHHAAEASIGRVGARRVEQADEGVDLLVGQPLAFELRRAERREEIVPRFPSALVDQRLQIRIELAFGLQGELGVPGIGDQAVAPALQLFEVRRREVEQARDDGKRITHGVVMDEIGRILGQQIDRRAHGRPASGRPRRTPS